MATAALEFESRDASSSALEQRATTSWPIEILSGARDLEQISRWVTDDVYRHLLKRVVLSARAREARGRAVARPTFTIGSTTMSEPRDGVVEAVVIVHGRARTRAVALRLEGLDNRWRATAINVL